LYYQFPNDKKAISIGDQFMWGDAFMVAPVLQKEQKTKEVYLPEGRWFDFNEHQFYTGLQTITFNTDKFKYPVLVKAGSFIPQYINKVQNTQELSESNITVLYIPTDMASAYQLYLDDGISKNAIVKKEYELISFSTKGKTASSLNFSITSDGGIFKGKPKKEKITLQIPGIAHMPKKIKINGKKITLINGIESKVQTKADQAVWNFEKQHLLSLPVIFTGKPVRILINW
jgi:alpha-glucosidase (family GH31 glycosyl hydrolase)